MGPVHLKVKIALSNRTGDEQGSESFMLYDLCSTCRLDAHLCPGHHFQGISPFNRAPLNVPDQILDLELTYQTDWTLFDKYACVLLNTVSTFFLEMANSPVNKSGGR